MKEEIKKGATWRRGYQQGVKEENEAWCGRRRCSICGNAMKPKITTDTCDKCFEEN